MKIMIVLPNMVNMFSYYQVLKLILMSSKMIGVRYRRGLVLAFHCRCWKEDLCYPSPTRRIARSPADSDLGLAVSSGVVSLL